MNYSPPPTLYVDAEGVHALRALAPDDLAQATVDAYRQFKRGGWTFAVLLAKAYEARAWRPRYATFPEWGRDGIGIADTNRLFKYRRAGAFILERPLEEQARWLNVPVSNVLEALPDARKDPLGTLAIVTDTPQAQIRVALALKRPEQHQDISPRRTVRYVVSQNVRDEWRKAHNIIKMHLGLGGSKWPTDDEVVMALTQTVLQAPELTALIPPEYREAVEAGETQCKMCRSWSQLERHHLVPRSMGGHDGPLIWLCRDCHDKVTFHREGWSWRVLADRLGHPEIAEMWAAVEEPVEVSASADAQGQEHA